MTEQEWLECTEPKQMLEFLRAQGELRSGLGRGKIRHFACGCARRVRQLMSKRGRRWLDLGEQLAEGRLSKAEQRQADAEQLGAVNAQRPDQLADAAAWYTLGGTMLAVASGASEMAAGAPAMKLWLRVRDENKYRQRKQEELAALAELLRHIFGNPFHPVSINPNWRTDTVVSLAQAIHNRRAFKRLPNLADALEDAGCDNADILNHCRQTGEHFRGCWCVDLVLGKE